MQNSESFYIYIFKRFKLFVHFQLIIIAIRSAGLVYHAERNNLMEYVTEKICSYLSKLKGQKVLYKKSIGLKNLLKKKVIKDVDLRWLPDARNKQKLG